MNIWVEWWKKEDEEKELYCRSTAATWPQQQTNCQILFFLCVGSMGRHLTGSFSYNQRK